MFICQIFQFIMLPLFWYIAFLFNLTALILVKIKFYDRFLCAKVLQVCNIQTFDKIYVKHRHRDNVNESKFRLIVT